MVILTVCKKKHVGSISAMWVDMNWPKRDKLQIGPIVPQTVAILDLLMLSLIVFSGKIGFSSYHLLFHHYFLSLLHPRKCLVHFLKPSPPQKKTFTSLGSVHELPSGGVLAETSKLSTGRMKCRSEKKTGEC